ncbi:MAG: TonB-dependent receptor plug domain-containing protein [Bacteroidales bacterium]
MRIKFTMVFSIALLLILPQTYGNTDDPADNIRNRLHTFSTFSQPQKVFLHFDKSGYKAGETIWFKSYLFDGILNSPDTSNVNIYVEMINRKGEIIDIRILMAENGYAAGDIALQPDLPEGNYVIRAYSDWMKNFSDDYYFTRHMYILNPDYENIIPRREVRRNKRFNRNIESLSGNYEVAFFPEGGNLVAGSETRVALKIVDLFGAGQMAEGELFDGKGDVITSFRTGSTGLGIFEFIPEKGNSYYASISINDGRPGRYDLPEVISEGYSLRINQTDNRISLLVNSTIAIDNPQYTEDLIIIGHTRGIPRYVQTFRSDNYKIETTIENDLFPSGIAHFTLFNGNSVPVAERLVYIDRGDGILFSSSISSENTNGQDFLNMQIGVLDNNGNPVSGSFSVSAVVGPEDTYNQYDDIVSYILLSSELRETINEPTAYFHSDPDENITIDNLLLTYGWRRFNWDVVLSGELPDINYTPVRGIELGGRLIDPAKNEGVSYHPVELKVRSGFDDTFNTSTSSGGEFSFPGLLYEGVFDVELSSRRLPGNYPPVFNLDIGTGSEFDYYPGIYTRKNQITSRGENWERVPRDISPATYATTLERKAAPQQFGVPDQTIYINYETADRNLFEVLQNQGSGLYFDGGNVFIRGVRSSDLASSGARFMLDGRFVAPSVFLSKYPKDVERIEIFRGTSTAIFGSRGGTGVILAYSRKHDYSGHEDIMELMVLGYHSPREFFSDYITLTNDNDPDLQPETTIFWEPGLFTGDDGMMNLSVPLYKGYRVIRFTIQGAGIDGGLGYGGINVEIEQ